MVSARYPIRHTNPPSYSRSMVSGNAAYSTDKENRIGTACSSTRVSGNTATNTVWASSTTRTASSNTMASGRKGFGTDKESGIPIKASYGMKVSGDTTCATDKDKRDFGATTNSGTRASGNTTRCMVTVSDTTTTETVFTCLTASR